MMGSNRIDERIVGIFTFLLLVLPVLSAQAVVWEDVTVITVDGWEYPNMVVEGALGEDFVVMINPGGGQRRLPRSRIRVIVDADGRDITQSVLLAEGEGSTARIEEEPPTGEQPETPPESDQTPGVEGEPPTNSVDDSAESSRSNTSSASSASGNERSQRLRQILRPGPRFRFAPSLGVGYGTPTGEWFDGMTAGLAIDGKVRITISESLYFALTYCHQSLGVESSLENVEGYRIEWDVNLVEYLFSLGAMSDPDKVTTPIAYLECGLGVIEHKMNFRVTDLGPNDDYELLNAVQNMDLSEFGLTLDGGGIIPLSKNSAVDLGVSMRMTSNGESEPYNSTGWILGIRAGFTVLLGNG